VDGVDPGMREKERHKPLEGHVGGEEGVKARRWRRKEEERRRGRREDAAWRRGMTGREERRSLQLQGMDGVIGKVQKKGRCA